MQEVQAAYQSKSNASSAHMPYLPGLDGIRALAIIAVLIYHLSPRTLGGGFIGVNVFFTLSGYLIMRLLLEEVRASGGINLVQFYLRRIKRLLPASIFVIATTALVAAFVSPYLLSKMRTDVIPTLLFVNNWHQIFSQQSYFGGLGLPSPLTHFWSLAIEEQFYFVLPPVVALCFAMHTKKKPLVLVLSALMCASALAMFMLYVPAQDPSRVYYGTDTRAFALLIGVLWAIVSRPWPTNAKGERPPALVKFVYSAPFCDVFALIALLILVWMCLGQNSSSAFMYRGGFVLCSIATIALINACQRSASMVGRLLALPLLVHVGKISYGLYLIHYPVMLLARPANLAVELPLWLPYAQAAISFALAEFSYHVIETPIRRMGRVPNVRTRLSATLVGAGAVAALAAFVLVPNTTIVQEGALGPGSDGGEEQAQDATVLPQEGTTNTAASMLETDSTDEAIQNMTLRAQSIIAAQTYAREHGYTKDDRDDEQRAFDAKIAQMPWDGSAYNLTMIGDSVSTGLTSIFPEAFPNSYLDAKWARKFSEGLDILRNLLEEGKVGNIVLLQLGTNGYLTDDLIAEAMDLLGSERAVWFITTRSPEWTIELTNEALPRAVQKYENLHYIDWYGLSAGHSEYFQADGIHLTSEGAPVYMAMIANAIRWELPGLN